MDEQLKQRWRLVLGRYANALDTRLSSRQQQQDEVLQQLYQEGQLQRGFKVSAGLGESELAVTNWLEAAETCFPVRSTTGCSPMRSSALGCIRCWSSRRCWKRSLPVWGC